MVHGFEPPLSSLLTPQSLETAPDSASSPLSTSPCSCSVSLSLSKINKNKKNCFYIVLILPETEIHADPIDLGT